jgi:hypothetical protein
MRKTIFAVMFLLVLLRVDCPAVDFKIFDARNKIFEESKKIQSMMGASKDALVLSSMFDACALASSQIDAYFSMLSIYNSIKKKDLNQQPVDSLISWLKEMKMTNEINVNNLSTVSDHLESGSKASLARLKSYFEELNKLISVELNKVYTIKESLKVKTKK